MKFLAEQARYEKRRSASARPTLQTGTHGPLGDLRSASNDDTSNRVTVSVGSVGIQLSTL